VNAAATKKKMLNWRKRVWPRWKLRETHYWKWIKL